MTEAQARPAGREIVLEARGARVIARLEEELAPEAAERLWSAFPIRTDLLQSRWSGETTYAVVPELCDPGLAVENPATFMCPGTVHLAPSKGNLGLPYGQAQSRDLGGDSTWGTHVATLVGDTRAFFAVLRAIVREGANELTITRSGEGS